MRELWEERGDTNFCSYGLVPLLSHALIRVRADLSFRDDAEPSEGN